VDVLNFAHSNIKPQRTFSFPQCLLFARPRIKLLWWCANKVSIPPRLHFSTTEVYLSYSFFWKILCEIPFFVLRLAISPFCTTYQWWFEFLSESSKLRCPLYDRRILSKLPTTLHKPVKQFLSSRRSLSSPCNCTFKKRPFDGTQIRSPLFRAQCSACSSIVFILQTTNTLLWKVILPITCREQNDMKI